MATNKFATILHKNTNKIVVILTYTVLEWVLIALLLLNSLFSYMILKFAEYFGLKPPCLWCSRVDHLFEPSKNHNVYRDFVCETHAAEICKLGFCSKHTKLAESQDMCEDCSSSRQNSHGKSMDIGGKIALFSWVKDMGMIKSDGNGEKEIDDSENDLRCSCCGGVRLNKGFYSPYLLFKPSWGVLDYTQKGSFVTTEVSGDDDHHQNDGGESSDPCKSDCPTDRFDDEFDGKRNRVEDDEADEEEDEEEEEELEEDEEEDGDSEDNKMLSYVDIGVENKDDDDEEEEDCSGSPSSFQFKRIEIDEDDAVSEKMEEPIRDEDVRKTHFCCIEDASFEMITGRNLGYWADLDDHRLVPVESLDSITLKDQIEFEFRNVGHEKDRDLEGLFDSESQVLKQPELVSDKQIKEEIKLQAMDEKDDPSHGDLESVDAGRNEIYLVSHLEEHGTVLCTAVCDEAAIEATRQLSGDGDNVEVATERRLEMRDLMQSQASGEESLNILDDEARSDSLFIGKISHQVSTRFPQVHGSTLSLPYPQADQSTTNGKEAEECTDSNAFMDENDQQGSKQVEETKVENRNMPVDQTEQRIRHQFSISSEFNEVEEDRAPETPTSVESFLHLHKKLLLFERKESGTEESLDGGSVVSEMEIGEGVLTIERLKSVLKAEHKALSALYAELEEERSASAVAANQTMAMITRLQEEKAAMQMEALQYQRMMEEQSEYDQEALQLLNELMIKREKEKQELEKELEIYRKKVLQYEAKEKKKRNNKTGSGRSGTSSTSSNVDSDEISVDLSHEGAEDGFYNHQENSNQNTPADSVLNLEVIGLETARHLSTLDESLADFEEERQAILEQLKALEEKLFMLDDSEQQFEDVRPVEHLLQDNREELDETKGLVNGFPDDLDGKLHDQERRNMGPKAKRLLPLFDAIGMENNDEELNEEDHAVSNAIVSQHSAISKFTPDDDKRLAIEEEVDLVYERLQALEADREFLKHCISSLKKGDKGMDLLQEILQHLRDLRSVELRCRNMGDSLVS